MLGTALSTDLTIDLTYRMKPTGPAKPWVIYNGILVPVRTSFGLRRRGGKTYNVSTQGWCGYVERRKECYVGNLDGQQIV